ncbi:MAG: hypothetical protein C0467_28195 [Planctomycetaceae bacterium]|nr:hypothetical protein [Planctomycetaceae bacterium]
MLSTRLIPTVLAILGSATVCMAATPKEVEAAVEKGNVYLKEQFNGVRGAKIAEKHDGIGVAALAGLALLESGTPANDAVVKAIAGGVRDASFTEVGTYHITLCLLFLDRLGDPADVPIIQMLGVRLLAGQNANGGWSYDCVSAVPAADERVLRASLMVAELKAGAKAPPADPANPVQPAAVGRLHAEVEKYAAKLATIRDRNLNDDNSNTQFGILGVWVARRHGVRADAALERIEKRFLATQTNTGGWPYSGHGQGSPSMTCAGLLGLATAVGLREERRMKAEAPRKPDPAPKANSPAPPAKSDDPFFNPPVVTKTDDPFFNPPKAAVKPKDAPKPKEAAKLPLDARDAAIQRGLAALGAVLAGDAPAGGKGKAGRNRVLAGNGLGDRDYYFLWSLERVGVVYGLEKIGDTNWYDLGADELVAAQNPGGAWGKGARNDVVDTSFALLFLSRSNLVRDLTARVQKDPANTELRAVRLPNDAPVTAPMPKSPDGIAPEPVVPTPKPTPFPIPAPVPLPTPTITPVAVDPKGIAVDLVGASDADWDAMLTKVRDGKGTPYTHALLLAITKLDGERRKSVREALAERLTRMNADTLRTMAKAEEPELRRAAVLAMAMKDDKVHIPDLVAALADEEPSVARAALAGLKGVTGQDFGPAPNATPAERAAAIRAWADWIRKQR